MNAEKIYKWNELDQMLDSMDGTEAAMYKSLVKIKYHARNCASMLTRKCKAYLWFILGVVASIPLCGVGYMCLWNWFLAGDVSRMVGWLQAYCIVFTLRIILLGICSVKGGYGYIAEVMKAANNLASIFDSWNLSDPACIFIYTFFNEVKWPVLGMCAGFILKTILYL